MENERKTRGEARGEATRQATRYIKQRWEVIRSLYWIQDVSRSVVVGRVELWNVLRVPRALNGALARIQPRWLCDEASQDRLKSLHCFDQMSVTLNELTVSGEQIRSAL
jgi:hypothetical protein